MWCKLTTTIILWKAFNLSSIQVLQCNKESRLQCAFILCSMCMDIHFTQLARSSRRESVAVYKYSGLFFDVKWPFPLSIFSAIWAMRFDAPVVLTWGCQPSSLARKWLYLGPSLRLMRDRPVRNSWMWYCSPTHVSVYGGTLCMKVQSCSKKKILELLNHGSI